MEDEDVRREAAQEVITPEAQEIRDLLKAFSDLPQSEQAAIRVRVKETMDSDYEQVLLGNRGVAPSEEVVIANIMRGRNLAPT